MTSQSTPNGHNPKSSSYLEQNFLAVIEGVFKNCFNKPAFSDFDTTRSYTYGQTAYKISVLGALFSSLGLQKGDRIALYAKDSAHWCVAFTSIMANGMTLVPILSDFNRKDACKLVEHSEAKILFIDEEPDEELNHEVLSNIVCIIRTTDFKVLYISPEKEDAKQRFEQHFADAAREKAFQAKDIRFESRDNSELFIINYTSGTTGFSKGVMLSGQNLAGNALYAHRLNLMKEGDDVLCFLPLAHAYSCAFNLLTPLTLGAHITLLGKMPTASILVKALKAVRPQLVVTVPLILEKIYTLAIQPKLEQPAMKAMLKIPFIRQVIYSNINRHLRKVFGGRCYEVIAGGAAMREDVAKFLHKIKFPLTVGYGMTECGPLISYENHTRWIPGSCGKILDNMELQLRSEESDEGQQVYEIWVRGMNVCLGYYKNEAATATLFDKEGWMHTGDLGKLDKKGNLYIMGRLKNMLLSASGQNIYPEEIESRICENPLVAECVVILDKNVLKALIVLDEDVMQRDKITRAEAEEKVRAYRDTLNHKVASYERVAAFVFRDEPFEKTPKRSIKRFLYTKA